MEKFEAFSPESWAYAAQMTIIGMGMIFAVLALLWLILTLFRVFFGVKDAPSKKKEVQEEKHETKAVKSTVVSDPVVNSAGDDAVTAAIITAAIAAYMAEQGIPEDGFRVVSFKRAQNSRAWNNK